MNQRQTVAFIDLVGSTGFFESVGNEKAASVIAQIMQWIGRVVRAHGGHVEKYMGDGMLTRFTHSHQAIETAVFLQRSHTERLLKWPPALRMAMQIGIAKGDVIHTGHDTLGDALNLAARLSSMAGANAIWATESVVTDVRAFRETGYGAATTAVNNIIFDDLRYRSLGQMPVRGLVQPPTIYQIEWQENLSTDLMTVSGALDQLLEEEGAHTPEPPAPPAHIELSLRGQSQTFTQNSLPLTIGRMPGCGFIVNDQRVSRQHAQLRWSDGVFTLTDISSYGTWVRFAASPTAEIQLRRTHCILHAAGQISLGAPFGDPQAPLITFQIQLSPNSKRMPLQG